MACNTHVDANPGASLELCIHRCLVWSQMTSVRSIQEEEPLPLLHNGFSPLCACTQWSGVCVGQGVGGRAQRGGDGAESSWRMHTCPAAD